MNLLDLPAEVLVEIAKRLDTKSHFALWSTCTRLQNVVRNKGVMGTATFYEAIDAEKYLGLVDLAPYITGLNLSSSMITWTNLQFSFPWFTNLSSISLIGTTITMWEAGIICELCPTITQLTVFFDWPNYGNSEEISRRMVDYCKISFKNLKNVCFRSKSEEILKCGHVFNVLQMSESLEMLRIDVVFDEGLMTSFYHFDCEQPMPPSLTSFSVNLSQSLNLSPYNTGLVFEQFRNSDWEYVMMKQQGDTFKFETTERIWERANNMPHFRNCVVPLQKNERYLDNLLSFDAFKVPKDADRHDFDYVIGKMYDCIPERVCKKIQYPETRVETLHISPCVFTLRESVNKQESRDVLIFDLTDKVKPAYHLKVLLDGWCECYCAESEVPHYPLHIIETRVFQYLTVLLITSFPIDESFKNVFQICVNLNTLKLIGTSHSIEEYGFQHALNNIGESKSMKYLTIVDIKFSMEGFIKQIKSPTLIEVQVAAKEDKNLDCEVFMDLIDNCPNLRIFFLNFTSKQSFVQEVDILKNYLNDQLQAKEYAGKHLSVQIDHFLEEYLLRTKELNLRMFGFMNYH